MEKHIMLLRGINVSGHKKVPMKELKTLLESIGFEKVQTYIQSGNVVFESEKSHGQLQKQAETAIQEHFGFEVKCLVLTREEFLRIFNEHPFYKEGHPTEKLYYTLLFKKPSEKKLPLLKAINTNGEQFQLTEKRFIFFMKTAMERPKFQIRLLSKN